MISFTEIRNEGWGVGDLGMGCFLILISAIGVEWVGRGVEGKEDIRVVGWGVGCT